MPISVRDLIARRFPSPPKHTARANVGGKLWRGMDAVGRPSMGSSAAPMIEEKRRGRVKNGSRSSNANPRYRKRERDTRVEKKKKKISTSPLYSFTMKILNSLFVKLARILTVRVTMTFFRPCEVYSFEV